jgi:quercetin dioxygenase-like cupin family protein
MKEINRDEGGIEHYFKRGLDSFGLFHHLIIPEISNYLQEEHEQNLVKIFKGNAIIAQKLPKLLKREESYGIVYEHLLLVKSVLEKGEVLAKRHSKHAEQANYVYSGRKKVNINIYKAISTPTTGIFR